MAERFTKLYTTDSVPWLPDFPVLVMAGALLRDAYSGNLLCQLRLRSVSSGTIRALTVRIELLDAAGRALKPVKRHQFSDLSLQRDGEVGSRTAIVLPRRDARAFSAAVEEVIFDDGGIWHPDPAAAPQFLPAPALLEDACGDAQVAEQFRINYGPDCRYLPAETEGFWYCACGAVNRPEEAGCHCCGRQRSALLAISLDALRREARDRAVSEQKRSAEDREDAKRRRWKLLKLAAVVLPLLILAAGLLKVMPGYLQQRRDYHSAQELLSAGRYEEAGDAFAALGAFRDSAEQAERNVPYQRALAILSAADAGDEHALALIGRSRADVTDRITPAMLLYQAALEEFEALEGYRDSASCAERCRAGITAQQQAVRQHAYDEAAQLLESGQYSRARQAFLALGSFSDSAAMAQEAVYRKACGLYDYLCRYDVRQIYADLSITPERGSSFVMSKEAALALGSQCVTDLYAACGEDSADVNLADEPGSSMRPLAECVTALFEQLGDYRDSRETIDRIRDATDYTREFYLLCETGDLSSAYQWLAAYEGEFEGRDLWRQRLEAYHPFCSGWALYSGDATAIPMAAGRSASCTACTTRVLLNRDGSALLRLSANDGEEYYLDFYQDPGSGFFTDYSDPVYNDVVVINNLGRMSFLRYDGSGNLMTSCEYSPG